jgi:hypothetical protein
MHAAVIPLSQVALILEGSKEILSLVDQSINQSDIPCCGWEWPNMQLHRLARCDCIVLVWDIVWLFSQAIKGNNRLAMMRTFQNVKQRRFHSLKWYST